MIVKQLFKVGDVVRYIPMGDKEYVINEDTTRVLFPLYLETEKGHRVGFNMYGHTETWHTHPLLILIRRTEEKKKWYQVFYKYTEEEGGGVFLLFQLVHQ